MSCINNLWLALLGEIGSRDLWRRFEGVWTYSLSEPRQFVMCNVQRVVETIGDTA